MHPGAAPSARSVREDKRVTAVSTESPGTPNSGEPPRLPLRWAVIIGVTVAVGIACFAAGGIVAAVAAATAVAVALHELLVLGPAGPGHPWYPGPRDSRGRPGGQVRAKMSWARLVAVPRARTAFSRRQAMSRRCGSVWLAAEL